MAKELGIGVRVWIGWCPGEMVGGVFDARCKTGTIVDGPFKPGKVVTDRYTGEIQKLDGEFTRWNVALDGGGGVCATEDLLHPIDDDDPTADPERADRPEEVEA